MLATNPDQLDGFAPVLLLQPDEPPAHGSALGDHVVEVGKQHADVLGSHRLGVLQRLLEDLQPEMEPKKTKKNKNKKQMNTRPEKEKNKKKM